MLVFIILLCVYNTKWFWALAAPRMLGRSAYAMKDSFSFVKLICMIKRLGMLSVTVISVYTWMGILFMIKGSVLFYLTGGVIVLTCCSKFELSRNGSF